MSNVLFLGDLHAGHRNVAKFRKQFRDEQDHFEFMETQYHKQVTKRDKVIFTGDAVFTLDRLMQMRKWIGDKELALGNHDTDKLNVMQLSNVFGKIYALKRYREFWVSHAPMHPSELRGRVNIHGHVHSNTVNDPMYMNTSLENTGFKLISLHEIRQIINKRKLYNSQYGYYDVTTEEPIL